MGAAVAAYSALLAVLVARHAYWRDEVRALSIANELPSVGAILRELHVEGHPVLWYLLLRGGSALVTPAVALPLVSALVGVAAIAVFFRAAPFGPWLKLAFAFSLFPGFEYTVMARNYGISMLLLFGVAAVWPSRRERPLAVGALIALLANTNVHSAVLALCLLLAWAIDLWPRRHTVGRRAWPALAGAGALALAGVAFAVWTAYPPPDTSLSLARAEPLDRLRMGAAALANPGAVFERLFTAEELADTRRFAELGRRTTAAVVAADVFFLAVGVWLARRSRALCAAFAGALVAFTIFFAAVYTGWLRHQGLILIFVVALVWMAWRESADRGRAPAAGWDGRALVAVLTATFLFHDARLGLRARNDIVHPRSSSAPVGAWLRAHPEYAGATLMGEPSYFLEAVPYYAPHRLYMHRERTFRQWARFVRDAMGPVSPVALIERARALQASTGRPVLLVLGVPEPRAGVAGEEKYFWDSLVWTADEATRWARETRKLAEFTGSTDEQLRIFALR